MRRFVVELALAPLTVTIALVLATVERRLPSEDEIAGLIAEGFGDPV